MEDAGLSSILATILFVPLADEFVTRLDVPAKSQLLSMLRMLLFAWSNGASDSAFLTLLYAFGDKPEVVKQLLEKPPTGNDDELVDDEDIDDAMFCSDNQAADNDGEQPNKPSGKLLHAAAAAAFSKLTAYAKEQVHTAGSKLSVVLSDFRGGKDGEDEDAFSRWQLFLANSTFGAKSSRSAASTAMESGMQTRSAKRTAADAALLPPQGVRKGPAAAQIRLLGKRQRGGDEQDEAEDADIPAPAALGGDGNEDAEGAEECKEQAGVNGVRAQEQSLGFVRRYVLELLLKEMSDCKGLRLAPLPSKSLPFRLHKSRFQSWRWFMEEGKRCTASRRRCVCRRCSVCQPLSTQSSSTTATVSPLSVWNTTKRLQPGC